MELERLSGSDISEGAAFICRNNAPLFRLAFNLLSHGRSVRVAGSDIGPKMVATMRKLGANETSRAQVLALIGEWQADKEERGSTTAKDLADCMRVMAQQALTLSGAISYAEHLFKQQGSIHLLTGHKAKGLEFSTVYHLDPWLIGGSEQEMNLRYVIQTRASERYYEINSSEIGW